MKTSEEKNLAMLNVLVADDDPQMQLAIKASLSRKGHEVSIAGNGRAALDMLEAGNFDVIISDQRMPEMTGSEFLQAVMKRDLHIPFVMITAHGTIDQAVEAMQLGAADFITKPFSAEELLRVVERVSQLDLPSLEKRSQKVKRGRPIVTGDARMIRILEICESVARSDATVLIQGESGTGKELIAKLIHSASPRNAQNFVAVNCAALPDTLLESELFGHEKGAFTGAQNRKIGKFELAHGGSILLDEISEMELGLQAKLLRVLQEREVDRVGGKDPISVDVRVLATTNRNLEDMVKQGQFRADLFYRLNVIPITLPALRERRSDIRLLIEHFMRSFLGSDAPTLSADVFAKLESYSWPGNIRELQNAVERAAILSRGEQPQEQDFLLQRSESYSPHGQDVLAGGYTSDALPQEMASSNPSTFSSSFATSPLAAAIEVTRHGSMDDALRIRPGMTVAEMEKQLILETLKNTQNNRTQAAKMLGISIRTLRNKLHEYRADGTAMPEFLD